jgi:hypothetical protein
MVDAARSESLLCIGCSCSALSCSTTKRRVLHVIESGMPHVYSWQWHFMEGEVEDPSRLADAGSCVTLSAQHELTFHDATKTRALSLRCAQDGC